MGQIWHRSFRDMAAALSGGDRGPEFYDELYCDSRKWLANGWVDYIAPQLYWPIKQKEQSFPVLLKWWEDQNTQHRLIFPGIRFNSGKHVVSEAQETSDEILATRRQSGALGDILWHSKPLLTNQAGLADALRKGVYAQPALAPAYPWLEKDAGLPGPF